MSDYDWAAEQGDKWLANLAGLEAMMLQVDHPLLSRFADFLASANGHDGGSLRVADLASGGGGTTLAIEELAPDDAIIHGFDISNSLVAAANQRSKAGSKRAIFEALDLQLALPPAERYDFLVSRFGTMFFADPALAFANIHGWLRPNGKFVFAVWGDPKQNPWMSTFSQIVGEHVELPKPEHHAPGPFRYAKIDVLIEALSAAGFSNLEREDWRGQLPFGGGLNASDAVDFALSQFAISQPLEQAGSLVFARARRALVQALAAHEKNGIVSMDAYVHIISGGA